MRRRSLPAAAVLVAAGVLVAAPAAAQGPFALVNIGPDVTSTDARMAGRGGWGLAESDTLIPAFKNPAGLVPLTSVTVLANGFGENRRSEMEAGARTTRNTLLPNFRAAIPLARGRVAVTAGFRLLRTTDYATSQVLTMPAGPDTFFTYREQFVREGSQFGIPIALAWRPLAWASLSAGVEVVRGSTREILENDFLDPGGFRTAVLTTEDELSGTAAQFGLLLRPHRRLSLGATYRTAHDLDVEREISLGSVSARADTSFGLEVPERWGVGAAVLIGQRWRLGADWEAQPWSSFRGRPDWEAEMRDEWTLSFGLERREARRPEGGFGNLPLRVGAAMRRWGYSVAGEDIRERSVTLGTGFSFRNREGHLDVALGRGWVGDLQDHGSEDSYWRLTVSIVGMERWW